MYKIPPHRPLSDQIELEDAYALGYEMAFDCLAAAADRIDLLTLTDAEIDRIVGDYERRVRKPGGYLYDAAEHMMARNSSFCLFSAFRGGVERATDDFIARLRGWA